MKILNNAPWWLVSAGLHAVLILGAALIYVERLVALEDSTILCSLNSNRTAPPLFDSTRTVESPKGVPLQTEEKSESTEPPLWVPFAELSDKNRSNNNDNEHDSMRGVSHNFLSYRPGEVSAIRGTQANLNRGYVENIGIGKGGGGTGAYGDRDGGSNKWTTVAKNGCGIEQRTENAVSAALRWLGRHQSVDGGWSASGFNHKCGGGKCSGIGEADFDTGVTSLSILAFLGAGYTQLSRDEMVDPVAPERTIRPAEVVKKGLQWLLSHQDPEGCVGERGTKYMYNHAIAALALSEAYGMTAAELLKEPAQKAIDFLIASQNPGKGWRYGSRCGDNDTSVTGWAVMALKSAELSGLAFPASAFQGALNWLNEATEQNGYYRAGYNAAGTGKVFVPGKNEQFADHPSMSAVAVLSRIFIQKKRDPALNAAAFLTADLPAWKTGQVDFYYWYYASLALFQYDGPKGPAWAKWNEPMKNAIVPNQKTATAGCENGSWDPSADRWGFEGGRVYAAAINCLTLEVYYRYKNVFGTK